MASRVVQPNRICFVTHYFSREMIFSLFFHNVTKYAKARREERAELNDQRMSDKMLNSIFFCLNWRKTPKTFERKRNKKKTETIQRIETTTKRMNLIYNYYFSLFASSIAVCSSKAEVVHIRMVPKHHGLCDVQLTLCCVLYFFSSSVLSDIFLMQNRVLLCKEIKKKKRTKFPFELFEC